MTTRPTPDDKDAPGKYPSEPDHDAPASDYGEPDPDVRPDRVPETGFNPGRSPSSAAELRIQVEALLGRREAATPQAWAELGDEAREVVVALLDDWSIRSNEALFHRTIAALGTLRVKRAVPALSLLLHDKDESGLTKAYAANALGRIGERTAVAALADATRADDEMVRRQVAMALGRIDDDTAIPALLHLRDDPSTAVAEVAGEAVQRWEESTGQALGPKRRARPKGTRSSPRRRPRAGDDG